jgi:dGTPase
MPIFDVYESEPVRFPAPYAALSKDSRGRKEPTPRNPYRTDFQRDRDRIIHTTAFRRLQHKTQVFANLGEEKDHYRTRLTHTIEVAQISRTIARVLGLNEDLAEAVALAHDLGHTPFGHTGEDVLNSLLAEHGGFNHNVQSLRVVDFLEKRYPDCFGLNLTYEVREAIIKHESDQTIDIPDEFDAHENPLLEGQLVNFADEIAYDGHDIDDGLSSGLLALDQLKDAAFLQDIFTHIEHDLTEQSPDMIRFALVRDLVNRMVLDLGEEIVRRLKEHAVRSVQDVRAARWRLVGFSPRQEEFNRRLKEFLQANVYQHPRLERMRSHSREIVTALYDHYRDNPEAISTDFRERYPNQPRHRLVADYIAGMTDRFAQSEYEKLMTS